MGGGGGGSGNVNMNTRKEGCAGKSMKRIILIHGEANDRISLSTFVLCFLRAKVFEEEPVPGSKF
jgi:hypothetical protein